MSARPRGTATLTQAEAREFAARDVAAARRGHRTFLESRRCGFHDEARRARAYRDSAMRCARTSLARANGCDQPASARVLHGPKTPAVQEGTCHVVGAGVDTGVASVLATAHVAGGGGVV